MPQLNEQQRKAAEFFTGVCAVIAAFGAGKTTVMSS
jgi:superfamily I DNA/RNA helicase